MKFLGQAEGHFLAANKADPGDHLAEFYLAYHYAQTRDTARATEHVRQALLLQPEHLASLHLMALLLTSQGEFAEALDVVEQTLEEFPDNLSIIALKVRACFSVFIGRIDGGTKSFRNQSSCSTKPHHISFIQQTAVQQNITYIE